MSKDEKNPEKTGDSEGDQPSALTGSTEKEPDTSDKKPAGKPRGRGLGRALFLLILVCAAFSGGAYLAYYYLDQQFSQIAQQQNEQMAELSDSIDSLQQSDQGLLNNQRNLQGAINSVASDTEEQLLAFSDRISESAAEGNDDWTLAEAEFLLRIANQRLVTSGDRDSAIEMMQAADNILRELAYPELASVRRQLANDLSRVQMANSLDVEGIYFELEALAQQVANLEHFEPESLQATQMDPEPSNDLGRQLWNKIKETLARYVRIDTSPGEASYLLTDEQQVAQTLSVQLQVRQAQLALLSGQQDVYTRALTAAADAIDDFYVDSAASSASRARLRELAGVSLQTESLDISQSIRALSSVVNQLSRMGVE
ncbi:MAG: uroporphyrinogen-III C-methyltransferase [Porticoccaceae bacterium]